MITVKDIIDLSKPHPVVEGGRVLVIGNDNVEFSIVGGARGLYGDFINDFEVAIFDNFNNFVPFKDGNEVKGLVTPDELVDILYWVKNQEPRTQS